MSYRRVVWGVLLALVWTAESWAALFGDVRGIALDPQGRPIYEAKVFLRGHASKSPTVGQTNENGGFYFRAVTLGEYMIVIEKEGFKRVEQPLTVLPDSTPVLRFQLEIASLTQTFDIVAQPELMGSDSPTPTRLFSHQSEKPL